MNGSVRHSKTWRRSNVLAIPSLRSNCAAERSPASWSAAVLCRFWVEPPNAAVPFVGTESSKQNHAMQGVPGGITVRV